MKRWFLPQPGTRLDGEEARMPAGERTGIARRHAFGRLTISPDLSSTTDLQGLILLICCSLPGSVALAARPRAES